MLILWRNPDHARQPDVCERHEMLWFVSIQKLQWHSVDVEFFQVSSSSSIMSFISKYINWSIHIKEKLGHLNQLLFTVMGVHLGVHTVMGTEGLSLWSLHVLPMSSYQFLSQSRNILWHRLKSQKLTLSKSTRANALDLQPAQCVSPFCTLYAIINIL